MRRVRSLALWWFALFWLYLLYQGDLSHVDVIAAACAATLGAAVAEIARTVSPTAFGVERHWALQALTVPWRVVVEFGIVTWGLARRPRTPGRFRTVPLPARGRDPVVRGRRAFVALAATYSPNSYVVEVDERKGTALIHELVPRGRQELP